MADPGNNSGIRQQVSGIGHWCDDHDGLTPASDLGPLGGPSGFFQHEPGNTPAGPGALSEQHLHYNDGGFLQHYPVMDLLDDVVKYDVSNDEFETQRSLPAAASAQIGGLIWQNPAPYGSFLSHGNAGGFMFGAARPAPHTLQWLQTFSSKGFPAYSSYPYPVAGYMLPSHNIHQHSYPGGSPTTTTLSDFYPITNPDTDIVSPVKTTYDEIKLKQEPQPLRKRKVGRAPVSRRVKAMTKLFACDIPGCGKTYTLEKDLIRHRLYTNAHPELQGAAWVCREPRCKSYGKPYNRIDNYNRHIRTVHEKLKH